LYSIFPCCVHIHHTHIHTYIYIYIYIYIYHVHTYVCITTSKHKASYTEWAQVKKSEYHAYQFRFIKEDCVEVEF
jgi:hypothetical protein